MQRKPIARGLGWILAGLLALTLLPTANVAADDSSRTFPETGQTVSGRFLDYWTTNGGLAQQGYPISGEMQEKSDLNGQTYTVQYFERAVFEKHPENKPPYDVLLSQLGTFQYTKKYPQGAPGQVASTDNARFFSETGKTLGGVFRTYWEQHGGLAQQGYPLSDEFQEVSDLNGQTYTVQYFERAVFEKHPENKPPYDVLLSQLGTFQHKAKYEAPPPPTPAPPTAVPTTVAANPCSDVPKAQSATITPVCGHVANVFAIQITGFTPNEGISFWLTAPNGEVVGTVRPLNVGSHNGTLLDRVYGDELASLSSNPTGIWAVTYQGAKSGHQSIVWFKILPEGTPAPPPPGDCSGVPPAQDQVVTPTCGPRGTIFAATGSGFKPGEQVGFYTTLPSGGVAGSREVANADQNGQVIDVTVRTGSTSETGIWAVTMEGLKTGHKSIGYFKVTPAP